MSEARPGEDGLNPRTSRLRLAGGLAVLVLAAYMPALRGGFVISDDSVLARNPRLTAPDGLWRIWFSTESEQYQPLVQTSYWLEHRIWGLRPWGYHLVNVMLHVANALLVWSLLRKIGVKGAAVAAALFALHPVNVESVAWIYERKNVLSGLFYFLTFAALFRFDEDHGWRWYGIALLLFVAALLSKASTVVLPAVLLLYWWWGRTSWRWRKLAASIPFFVLAGSMAALTVWYEKQHTGAIGVEYSAGFAERFARAGGFVAFYLGKFFVPHNLMFFYPRWSVDPSAVCSYLPHVVMVVALIVLVSQRRTWGRPVLFGLGSYLIALFPVLGFFDIYYHRFSFVADHFQYLALVGLIALCVHGVACGLERWGSIGVGPVTNKARLGGHLLGIVAIGACWLLSWQQARIYQNTQTLCEDILRRAPDSWVANYKLGEYCVRTSGGRQEPTHRALDHFERALRLNPDHGPTLAAVGAVLGTLGRNDEALPYLRRAVAADPENPVFHINVGAILERRSDFPGAIAEYEEAVRCGPHLSTARVRLGQALIRAGRREEGIQRLREAADLSPNLGRNQLAVGSALCGAGCFDEGIPYLREAVRLNPNNRRAAAALQAAERQRRFQGDGSPATP